MSRKTYEILRSGGTNNVVVKIKKRKYGKHLKG